MRPSFTTETAVSNPTVYVGLGQAYLVDEGRTACSTCGASGGTVCEHWAGAGVSSVYDSTVGVGRGVLRSLWVHIFF